MDLSVKTYKVYHLFLVGAIIIITGLIICTNLFHYCYKMNSDIASEAVLAQLIWESGEWIPKSWYASSELRLYSTPNLAALFYGMVHDPALAMGMACVVMSFGILATSYFFISQFSFNKTQKLVFLLLCLIIPNHFVTLELFYLFAAYYAIHIIIMFLSLGIYARLISGKSTHILWQSIIVLLWFLMGMQGVRGLLILNGPLLVTETLRQFYLVYKKTWNKKNMLTVGRFVFLGVLAGYAGTLLPFSIDQDMNRNIRKGPVKLFKTVLPDIQDCLGLTDIESYGQILYFILLLIALIVFFEYILRVFRKQSDDPSIWVYFMFWNSTAISALAVAFTTIESSQRYFCVFLFGMAFGLTCSIKNANGKFLLLSGVEYGMIVFLFAFQVYTIYLPIMQNKGSDYSEEYEVCRYLEENEYPIAYANFEKANTITILSKGKVRVAPVASVETMEICKWLSSTEWYVPNVPYESQTAYIVTETEREAFEKFYSLHRKDIWFEKQIGMFYVYGSDYNFTFLH